MGEGNCIGTPAPIGHARHRHHRDADLRHLCGGRRADRLRPGGESDLRPLQGRERHHAGLDERGRSDAVIVKELPGRDYPSPPAVTVRGRDERRREEQLPPLRLTFVDGDGQLPGTRLAPNQYVGHARSGARGADWRLAHRRSDRHERLPEGAAPIEQRRKWRRGYRSAPGDHRAATRRFEVMTISSPLVQAPDPGGTPPKGGPGPRPRILVVEDHEDSREMLRQFLEFEGYDVEVAADGRVGVDAALERPPVVALIDLGLPKLDGFEVARAIRERFGHRCLARGADEPDDARRSSPERGSGLRPARGQAGGDRSAQGHPSRYRVTGELTPDGARRLQTTVVTPHGRAVL